jgi:hypothetical protein
VNVLLREVWIYHFSSPAKPRKNEANIQKKKKKKKKKNFAKEPPYMGMRFCRKKFEICDSHGILQKNHSFLFISHLIVLLPLLIAI